MSGIDNKQYLGDGVYAHFDGYGIWLGVNHHDNTVVYLEPDVLDNLNRAAKVWYDDVKKSSTKTRSL